MMDRHSLKVKVGSGRVIDVQLADYITTIVTKSNGMSLEDDEDQPQRTLVMTSTILMNDWTQMKKVRCR
jgi:hypothetical protein